MKSKDILLIAALFATLISAFTPEDITSVYIYKLPVIIKSPALTSDCALNYNTEDTSLKFKCGQSVK